MNNNRRNSNYLNKFMKSTTGLILILLAYFLYNYTSFGTVIDKNILGRENNQEQVQKSNKQSKNASQKSSNNAITDSDINELVDNAIENQQIVTEVNNNIPNFTVEDLDPNSEVNKEFRGTFLEKQESLDWFELNKKGFMEDPVTWESISELDELNRVGQGNAMLSKSIEPTEKRAPRLKTSPSGWKQQWIGDKTVYDRSHIIGYQFTGHNDEIRNLMTGTSEFNKSTGMEKYERKVRDTIKEGKHVRYRVTPIFRDNELIPRAVQMEAQSIEDDSLAFNVIIANIVTGYSVDYNTAKITKLQ